jgi:rod shape-determining protein MreC
MARIPRQSKATLVVVVFCALIFLLYYVGLPRYSSSLVIAALNPVIGAGHTLSDHLGDFFSLYTRRSDMSERYDLMTEELIILARKNADLSLAKAENALLKKEIQFIDEYHYRHVIARVIGQNIDFENNYLIIDKGSRDGLAVGLPVTIHQGQIIGRLTKVEENLSEVGLLTGNNSKIAVLVLGEESASGLAVGEHNLNLKIEMLESGAKIAEGDLVVTSNLNLDIPSGLVLGEIKKISTTDTALWQSAVVEPLAPYLSSSLVTIILPDEKQ